MSVSKQNQEIFVENDFFLCGCVRLKKKHSLYKTLLRFFLTYKTWFLLFISTKTIYWENGWWKRKSCSNTRKLLNLFVWKYYYYYFLTNSIKVFVKIVASKHFPMKDSDLLVVNNWVSYLFSCIYFVRKKNIILKI